MSQRDICSSPISRSLTRSLARSHTVSFSFIQSFQCDIWSKKEKKKTPSPNTSVLIYNHSISQSFIGKKEKYK